MPARIILKDVLGFTMNPYKRYVVKHTRKYFRRALKKAVNDSQKKLWITAGIAAEELVLTLLQINPKLNLEVFNYRRLRMDAEDKHVLAVLHAYLSTLVVSVSTNKQVVLKSTAMTEQTFLQNWCWVFEYTQEDMKVFDEVMLPAFRQQGYSGLAQRIGQIILDNLYQKTHELTSEEIVILEEILLKDVSGIIQYVQRSSLKEG